MTALAARFGRERSTVLAREEATRRGLLCALGERAPLRVLHLACHGTIDTKHPRLTGLVLSHGEVLTLDDVYRLRLDADLAVLSACDTGRGRLVGGEGSFGLARGFFIAGARRVIVSNWRVDDRSTQRHCAAPSWPCCLTGRRGAPLAGPPSFCGALAADGQLGWL